MPSIKKRGDTYRIMVSLGYGMDGKQIRKTTTYRPPADVTEGKAEKLATAFAYEFEKHCQGMTSLDENIRFKDLYDWYFEQIAPHKLKENTIYNNRRILELYVLPYIGHLKLKDINTARIDALFNKLHQCGARTERYLLTDVGVVANGTRRPIFRKSGVTMETMRRMVEGAPVTKDTALKICEATGRRLGDCFRKVQEDHGLTEGTVKRIRTALSPIFSTAVKKELLLKNPVTNATNPKDAEVEEHPFLDAGQCRELLRLADDFTNPQIPRIIRTLLYTGMRSGELCALHWEDVDLDNAVLEIKYNLYRVNGEYKLSSPKTKSSARLIALPPQVVDILREQKVWQTKEETWYIYTLSYNGEGYFADTVFHLTDDQKALAGDYAQNLSLFLGDGMFQYTEYGGTTIASLGNIRFTDGATEVVYFNQLDERWANKPYGTDNIGGYGCGPTSMSIVVSSLTDDIVDPVEMAEWAYKNGGWCSKSGSYHSLIPNAAKAWGLPVEGCTASEPQRIVDALSEGKLVVAIMLKGHFTTGGHFIVLRGVQDGKILVADPASYNRSQKLWDLSIILNEASKRAGAGGPFWIIG